MTLFNCFLDTIMIILYLLVFKRISCYQFIDCRSRQCRKSYIICVDNENCEIDCGFFSKACQSSIIICPMNANCNIKCDTQEACDNTIVRAENSNILNIECNSHIQSCYDLNVYCPENKGQKTCKISGFYDFVGMNVFTMNGFIDIQFDIQISLPSTTIHCNSPTSKTKYDESCVVSPTFPHTKCINDTNNNNNLCNHIITTLSPTNLPTKIATISPTNLPTISPTKIATISPTKIATISPTEIPTISPTKIATISPTKIPTISPTKIPTKIPTISPTKIPTKIPTISPTKIPTISPTKIPTISPTKIPTISPTKYPTNLPSSIPTISPSLKPTIKPTANPILKPTTNPTINPTLKPTINPTLKPSKKPTKIPTINPTIKPRKNLSNNPTLKPTLIPTDKPSNIPSISLTLTPTTKQTKIPTKSLTKLPTFVATKSQTFLFTKSYSNDPTKSPTNYPVKLPTETPSKSPTFRPTKSPSNSPIKSSTENPSIFPTLSPTLTPSMTPDYDRLITTTEMMETFIINTKYNINNNYDDIENDETKPIIINLTNLMYVLIGTVFMCCFVCGCCFLFNILSNRVEANKRKWSDWSSRSNDIKDGFVFRNSSNSSSEICSDPHDEEKQRDQGNTANTANTNNNAGDVLGSDYSSDIINDILTETNINDAIVINECEGAEYHDKRLNIKQIIDNMNINNINKRETDDLFNIPSRHTEEDVYIINMMEKQNQLSKIEGIHNQIQAQQNKVNDDKFSMKLMNSVVDDKLLSNNIINDIQRSQQEKQQ